MVGILSSEPGWEIVLDQIGANWKSIGLEDELTPENFSAIIVNVIPTSLQTRSLHEFLLSGGAILGIHGCAREIYTSSAQKSYFSSLSPFQFGEFPQNEMMDIFSDVIIETNVAREAIHFVSTHLIGKGVLLNIPFDVNALMLDVRSRRKNFYFEKKRLPSEIVATVSKGILRRFLTRALESLHRHRKVPFVHKWYFPEGEQTIFTFRVDSDAGTEQDVTELFELCKRNSIPTMWFLDTKSHQEWLGRFGTFADQDIGVHCYEHSTSVSYDRNEENFVRAVSLLEKNGIHPIGASAPFGTWNRAIARVFEHLGMSFSSEFSLDYDDMPFFPMIDKRFTPVLQIPIHPICVGSMRRAGYNDQEMLEYFRRIIDKKITEREPICLYHHPTHHRWDVIEGAFRYLRSKNIRALSYSQYARWWRERNAHTAELEYDPNERTIRATDVNDDANVYWRIVFPAGEESITPLRAVTKLDSLERRHTAQQPPPADIARVRRFDVRHVLMNSLDSWYKRTQ